MSNASALDIEKWQELLHASKADTAAWAKYCQENQQRTVVCNEMVTFLKRYLGGQCDTETLRETFDRKTRTEWMSFGLKGLSGGMFLNMLVKHIPDADSLAAHLHAVLPVPKDPQDGRGRMQSFMDYLVDLIQSGKVRKAQVQPARLPYFISAWWHLQDTEQWPIFYISGRKALEREGIYSSTGVAVKDYFAFRDCFLALAAALNLQSWDCEHLLDWCDKHPSGETGGNGGGGGAEPGDGNGGGEAGGEKADPSTHTRMQWLLAKIGQKLNCKVWIAVNDHSKVWNGQKLGDLSIKELPTLGLDAESQKVIRMIDVVWLKGTHQVSAAFEIEQTTSIYSGLLRMSDLVSLSPNLNFPLYLIAPEDRLNQVKTQLSRPTFQTLDLHNRCGFFSCESLLRHSDGILRCATSPAAIEQLAAKVEDTLS